MAPEARPVLTIRSAHLATWLRLNHIEPIGVERNPLITEPRSQWYYERTPEVEQLFAVWRKTLSEFINPNGSYNGSAR
jgi:hypothetical protein